jgi:hypothetical protein
MEPLEPVMYVFSAQVTVESAELDAHVISFSPNLIQNPEASISGRIPLPACREKAASRMIVWWNRLI